MNLNPTSLKSKALVLLSGGLDSTVALAETLQQYEVAFTLTFNYGQRAFVQELKASKSLSDFYNLPHEVIELPWLSQLLPQALTPKPDPSIPSTATTAPDFFETSRVWVPNRNALFLNIAAAFAEAHQIEYIVFGANWDEAQGFPDNTEAFRQQLNQVFELSTLTHPKVLAPMGNLSKAQILQRGQALGVPLEVIWSCYEGEAQQCGACPSCILLKRALDQAAVEVRLAFAQ